MPNRIQALFACLVAVLASSGCKVTGSADGGAADGLQRQRSPSILSLQNCEIDVRPKNTIRPLLEAAYEESEYVGSDPTRITFVFQNHWNVPASLELRPVGAAPRLVPLRAETWLTFKFRNGKLYARVKGEASYFEYEPFTTSLVPREPFVASYEQYFAHVMAALMDVALTFGIKEPTASSTNPAWPTPGQLGQP